MKDINTVIYDRIDEMFRVGYESDIYKASSEISDDVQVNEYKGVNKYQDNS